MGTTLRRGLVDFARLHGNLLHQKFQKTVYAHDAATAAERMATNDSSIRATQDQCIIVECIILLNFLTDFPPLEAQIYLSGIYLFSMKTPHAFEAADG